ncbi:MAG TPA: hypothetical protein VIX83_03650 [Candidatus Cybelea sp.]
MRFSALGLTAAAFLAASAAAPAQMPQTPGSNVGLTECTPRPYSAQTPLFQSTPYKGGLHATLTVQYRNEAPIVATDVVFGLVSGNRLIAVGKDSGRFSPGAAIDHRLMIDQQIYPLREPAQCVVLAVRYAGGASWMNPEPLQP